jgi:hypothetical protein
VVAQIFITQKAAVMAGNFRSIECLVMMGSQNREAGLVKQPGLYL